jgi:hypothetical protein
MATTRTTGAGSSPRNGEAGGPRAASDNAYDDVHEHPTEWVDVISVEASSPHPGSDPIEVSTEARTEHPERCRHSARGLARGLRMPQTARPGR